MAKYSIPINDYCFTVENLLNQLKNSSDIITNVSLLMRIKHITDSAIKERKPNTQDREKAKYLAK